MPVTIYNPFPDTLHIREVFTTEGFLSLKGVPLRNDNYLQRGKAASHNALSGSVDCLSSPWKCEEEAADIMWVVPPGAQKEVITLSFASTLGAGKYNGYVHLKTDRDNMVLPVDVEVLDGLVAQPEVLQFGVLTMAAERKTLKLWLANNGNEALEVVDILPQSPDVQLEVQLADSLLLSADGADILVATVTYLAKFSGNFSNTLTVFTNNSNMALSSVDVPYTATVFQGGVGFEPEKAVFMLSELSKQCTSSGAFLRTMVFTNYFNSAVVLENLQMTSCGDVFSLEHFELGGVANSFGQWSPVDIGFQAELVHNLSLVNPDYLPRICWLELLTNISSHRVPLHLMEGVLHLQFMDAVRLSLHYWRDLRR